MKRPEHGQRLVYCYGRVSTDDQAISLEAQVTRLRAYCEAMRPGEEVRILTDEGVSAKTLDRPALSGLLEACRARRVGTVVVLKLDRLTRSVRDLADLLAMFEKYGVALCSLTESLDTSTASGRLMLNLLASVSQWEREAISERTAFALAHKRRKREVYGRTPYGWKRLGSGLVPDLEQTEILKRVAAMRGDGASLRRVVAWLNVSGVPTPRGGSKWHLNTLYQVLTSKIAMESGAA